MEKIISKKIYLAVYFQIFLMISLTFTLSYFLSEASKSNNGFIEIKVNKSKANEEDIFLRALKIFNNLFWDQSNLVSATSTSDSLNSALNAADNYLFGYNGSMSTSTEITALDFELGIYTCPKDNKGRFCQEYPSSSCAQNCNVSCIPTPASQSAFCKPGTCYDVNEGSCAIGATKQTCQDSNGLWFNDPLGNLEICSAGCCVLGELALFITEKQCQKESVSSGVQRLFMPELKTEIACLALSKQQEEGACVLEDKLGNSCRFTSKTNCNMNLKGKFYSNYLCSNPDLNTKCTKQKTTGCYGEKDEVYWFDSCGNRENIYSINKEQSYNNGIVLNKSSSCNLDLTNKNTQRDCGNCNSFASSKCGPKIQGKQELSESNAEFVCRDLRCTDDEGKIRQNAESWCEYQGSINPDKGVFSNRSTTPVGSRSFKSTCYEGEIIVDPCADYDNEICTESSVKTDAGKDFSVAACRTNRAYECYQYNSEELKSDCTKNPDCSVKQVSISNNFKFDLCTPKYTPGFDLNQRGEGASTMCSFASQKCQVVSVKKLSGWKIVANAECANLQNFAEQMNDMCISLGDCGTKANYLGDLSVNHKIYKSSSRGIKSSSSGLGNEIGGEYAGLSNNYINKLTSYANEKTIKNNYIDAPSIEEFYGELGIPGSIGLPLESPSDKSAALRSQIQTISGAMGLVVMAAGTQTGLGVISHIGLASPVQGPTISGQGLGFVPSSGFAAFSGALTGAAIGFAVVSFLISYTGVGRGLPPKFTHALVAAGASAGAIIGVSMTMAGTTGLGTSAAAGSSSLISGLAAAAVVAWIVIIVIVVIIIIFTLLGIGKVKKDYYTFQCLPWQAPSGGAKCSECGKDGYPCSKYSCESLGQACELINEETEKPECINVAKNDTLPPVINLNESYFPLGYKIEKLDNGAKIIADTTNGCIPESFDTIIAGIDITEPSQCQLIVGGETENQNGAEQLSSGLYKSLHAIPISIPSLASLGLEDFNPSVKEEIDYKISCKDKAGNKNINAYSINFCIAPGVDITPVKILSKEPFYDIVMHDALEVNASIFTSEPADCKWSINDKKYELMEYNFSCANDFEQREGIFGWRCRDTLKVDSEEKTYYVRCMDQPFISAENSSNISGRNTNPESYLLKFNRAKKPLTIDSINLDNQIFEYNTTPASVEIIVKTSGGLDGSARCGYVWGNETIDFFETFSIEHRQVSPAFFPGNYALTIKCKDSIGETAEKISNFQINIDDSAPVITRTYVQAKTLYALTDEKSTCYYLKDIGENCYFDLEDKNISKAMSGINSLTHTLEINYGFTYNIKCVDEFSHYPGECTAVIKGVER